MCRARTSGKARVASGPKSWPLGSHKNNQELYPMLWGFCKSGHWDSNNLDNLEAPTSGCGFGLTRPEEVTDACTITWLERVVASHRSKAPPGSSVKSQAVGQLML